MPSRRWSPAALVIVAPGGFHGRQGREGDAEQRACCREFVGELFL
jgi:hypothetical protein